LPEHTEKTGKDAMTLSVNPRTSVSSESQIPGQRLSLVLPAHNEAPVIEQAISEAATALSSLGITWEVVVVDDGSTDDTADRARAAAAGRDEIRVVSLGRNEGYASALRRGFREARYELVAFTDADCQFDLRDLGSLLELTRDHDVACGYRADRQDPWLRKVYSAGFNVLARALLGTRVRDCDCALKVFRREWINSANLECQGFFFNAEVLSEATRAGLTVGEAPVTHRPRAAGQSKVSIGLIPPVFATLMRFWWSRVVFSRPEAVAESGGLTRFDVISAALLALVGGLMLLTRLSYPLMDPDESRYAQIAHEMVTTGDWLVPRRNGRPYLDKPPLLYWITAVSYQTFGLNEAAVHLVPAGAALLTVLATFLLGRLLVGSRPALWGAMLQLCSVGFLLSGRFLFMDTLLALFVNVSLLAGYAACRTATVRPGYWLLAAAACGLGFLTKGPIALALFLPPLLGARFLTGVGTSLRLRHWLVFGLTVAAIALPWFCALAAVQPQALFEFVWKHHVQRFVSGLEHAEPWWFFVPVLLVCMLPCSILFPAAIAYFRSNESAVRRRRNWDVGFLLMSAGWTLLLFSMARCKLPPYILPMFPAVCLVVGSAIWGVVSGESMRPFVAYVRSHSPRDLSLILCLAIVITGSIDLYLPGSTVLRKGIVWGALLAVGVAAVLPRVRRNAAGLSGWCAAGAFTLICLGSVTIDFYPRIAAMRSYVEPVRSICDAAGEVQSLPVMCLDLEQESDSIAFYFGGHSVRAYEGHRLAELTESVNSKGDTLILVQGHRWEQLRHSLPSSVSTEELGRCQHIVVVRAKTEVSAHAEVERTASSRGGFQGLMADAELDSADAADLE